MVMAATLSADAAGQGPLISLSLCTHIQIHGSEWFGEEMVPQEWYILQSAFSGWVGTEEVKSWMTRLVVLPRKTLGVTVHTVPKWQ